MSAPTMPNSRPNSGSSTGSSKLVPTAGIAIAAKPRGEMTILPVLESEELSLPHSLSKLEGALNRGHVGGELKNIDLESDLAACCKELGRAELSSLARSLEDYKKRMLDRLHNEFSNTSSLNRSSQIIKLLEWTSSAVKVVNSLLAADEIEKAKRALEYKPDEKSPFSRCLSKDIYDHLQGELDADRRERANRESLWGRSLSPDSRDGMNETKAERISRQAANLSFQSFDQAMLGELRILLLTNKIPTEHVDAIIRHLKC